jgi:uncharacterized protein (UPF0548 family)
MRMAGAAWGRAPGSRVGADCVPGAVVMLGLGIGSLRLQAPCRVVYMVDESRRRGFAYGTLAGHREAVKKPPWSSIMTTTR